MGARISVADAARRLKLGLPPDIWEDKFAAIALWVLYLFPFISIALAIAYIIIKITFASLK